MRNLIVVMLVCLAASGCGKDDGQVSGKPRTEREGGFSGKEESREEIPDTSIFVSAFRCMEDDGWWKSGDSFYIGDDFELVLFDDGEEILSLPVGVASGVSSNPALHHIYEGHLYTEMFDSGFTIIGRDGVELLRLEGNESLRGILEDGQDIYTLFMDGSGSGLTYRKNGETLLRKEDCIAFGGFEKPSYGQGGALYKDDSCVCFAFHPKNSGECFMVVDGEEHQVPVVPGNLCLDARRIHSKDAVAYIKEPGCSWKNSYLWPAEQLWYRTGECFGKGADAGFVALADFRGELISCMERKGGTLYWQEGIGLWGLLLRNGVLSLSAPGMPERILEDDCFFFSPCCATGFGEKRIIAVTPVEGNPYYIYGDEVTELEGLNGLLTGIGVKVSLPKRFP